MVLLISGCNPQVKTTDGIADEMGSGAKIGAFTDSLSFAEYGSMHKLVYVPTYSHIYVRDGSREFDLTATLSVRNTDPEHGIRILSVRYSDSNGNIVRDFLGGPTLLGPLSSRPFVIEENDRTGGVGANFIVEWRSDTLVSDPIIEAVMISTASSQGISFLSRGKVVRPIDGE